ncbi:alpha-tocopherol transfer protein-like [Melanaphis sacchari]|uniref:Alpha-tocopherol transfer protein-like n=1 Tax=Melanaphis sacchari TaxID=742174 RepID=A0A2H8TLK7_9HEMI|nr:alpha-tocopherol transfer protein-like [Melanaphis sacchari]
MITLEKYFKVSAQQEYEKNPQLSAADVEELLKWSDENINLYGKLIDIQIIMFLHACDYDKEYAKKVISQCYNLRAKKCAPFFTARDPAHPFNQRQLDVVNINIIPDEENRYGYIWSQLKIMDASEYYPTVASKLTFMAIELDQIEHGTKSGYRMVLDSNNFGLSHALRYSLSNARHLMLYVQEGTPFVIDKIYILNVTSGTERVYSMLKPFMSASLINKIIIKSVSKTSEFIKTLPQTIVPKDYGGLAPIMKETNEILKQRLLDNRNYFLDEEKFRNGSVKDEVNTTIIDEDENVHSFKNLSID